MKKGEFFECRKDRLIESDGGPTSEKLQSDVDSFLAAGGEIKTCNNLGKPIAAPKQELEINKLARGWINNHFPRPIAMMKAKNLGIAFKLVVKERKRIIDLANEARRRK